MKIQQKLFSFLLILFSFLFVFPAVSPAVFAVECCTAPKSPAAYPATGAIECMDQMSGGGGITWSSINCSITTEHCYIPLNHCILGAPTPAPTAGPNPTIAVYDPTCQTLDPAHHTIDGVRTALGCLPTNPQNFINIVTPWAIYVGAGVAFLLGLYGVLLMVTSVGNPEKMQAGKELIFSAGSGLLFITFAVFLLKIIGVDILGLF